MAQGHSKKKKNKRGNLPDYKADNQFTFLTPQAPTNRKMTLDLDSHPDLKSLLLSDIKEVNTDFGIEHDYGNKEYKLKLCDVNDERIEGLVTQMKFRLEEGRGECFYQIGVEDNGNPLGLPQEELEVSVDTVKKVVEKLNATATVIKLYKGKMGLIAEIMVKQKKDLIKNDKLEIKIGLLGEEGSGKSTLVSLSLK
jgi:GTPase